MSDLFAAFGIDWRLLLINLLNFGLLLWALWYFLYAPITRMLEERRRRVAQGVADAQEARQHLQEVADSRARMLESAGREADDVIAAARAGAAEKGRELIGASEASAAALMREAQAQAAELKRHAMEESRHEVAKLIILGMERAAQK